MKYDNIEDMISTLLGGKVRLFVPSCAMRELRDLAKQDKAYSAAVALARKFLRHKDACAPTESTHGILLKQVGNGNEQHWWLATQDKTLWATVREAAGGAVPVLYASATGVHLLPPSDELKAQVEKANMAQMKGSLPEKALVSEALGSEAAKPHKWRKHPSAPNPLAVRKSSKVTKQQDDSKQSKPRIRRKRHSNKEDIG
eukprot:jgi/Ulvmu1/9820/UM056_0061.1